MSKEIPNDREVPESMIVDIEVVNPLAPLGEWAEPIVRRMVGDITRQAAERLAPLILRHERLTFVLYDVQRRENRDIGYDPYNSLHTPCGVTFAVPRRAH